MRNFLTFDGVNSTDFGVYINGNQTYNAPARSREVISVPGRNGDLIIDNGRYENTELVYHAFIYRGFSLNVEGFRNFLLSKTGYKRLEDTYHPTEYREAIYSGNFEAEVVDWLEAGEFDLTFNCRPQRFQKDGERVIEYTASGSIMNMTSMIAKPLIRVYGTGRFAVNNSFFTISSANVYTDIDCEIMDAYKGTTNCNGNVSGKFPEFLPGINSITFDGVTKLEITPRWWVL